ncbi:N-acetylglucosamine-6-phosphate deacetylase [Halobacillus sp. ACCC02827]|uniref:N-acetylglucosamine-6-phosphate deacetylase n=1 Tax=Halobacillus sp. ACCC02827 TaxID=3052090 RepID=UPI00256FB170|nr:N-acetylglucosamine-6-phosphate deacetylase [Halobacillus sp. ACCC02827]WJE14172.1 N-acetylglucosamine-6-phosphate deacetylase [Halobacillus sp. ACCC02827]
MTDIMQIHNVRIVTDNEVIDNGTIQIKEGKIEKVEKGTIAPQGTVIDGRGNTLVPGFIDVHVHGAAGHDVMDASREALEGMALKLTEEGTTAFLATTMTQSKEAIEKALENAGDYIKYGQTPGNAEVIGIHLEGPFINENKAGAQPVEHIIPPSATLFDKWQEVSRGNIRLVTMDPESEAGLELCRHLSSVGVTASIGHSEATFDQAVKAADHGASHVTHLFNQMSGFHHREPGIVGAAFLDKRLKVEIIADYIHVHPEAVRAAYQMIGPDRLILITDAMRAKCLKDGTYDLGGQSVYVSGKEARLEDGTLAGSILRLEEAAEKIKKAMKMSWHDFVRITSLNAAEQTGVADKKGTITVGKDADIVLLDDQTQVSMTICKGIIAYDRRGNGAVDHRR